MIELKKSGVSEKIILAMLARQEDFTDWTMLSPTILFPRQLPEAEREPEIGDD